MILAALWLLDNSNKIKNHSLQERKKEEAAKKRAEAKRLAAEEEAALANLGKKKPAQKVSAPKVTHHQLEIMKEKEKILSEEEAKEREDEIKRQVSEDKYAKQIEVEIANRQDNTVEARSLDAALGALSVGGEADRHPEK